MAQEFDALKLLRQEQADNRSRFAHKRVASQRTKRQRAYTFVGRDADSGNAVLAQNGQAVNAGEITSNALIKPGQSVRVLVAPGKTNVKQLPKPVRSAQKSGGSKRLARLKWLTLIQKGSRLEFYLCGTRAVPQKVYSLKNFRETLTLTTPTNESAPYLGFTTAYSQLDYSPFDYVFDGVFSNLGAGEDEWMYTFGHSECLSYIEGEGGLIELIRRNRFYKLTPQGLTVFSKDTVTYGASPDIGAYPSRTYDYFNAGNGFFYRREMLNDYSTFIGNFGALVGRYHTLNRYSYISDQTINVGEGAITEVDGVIKIPPFFAGGTGEEIAGVMNFTPKLQPPNPVTFEYNLIPPYFFDFETSVWEGIDYFAPFQCNRQGTAAIAFGRYVRQEQLWSTQTLFSAKGKVQAPQSYDRPYSSNGSGLGDSVQPNNNDMRSFLFRADSVLKRYLARFKLNLSWQVSGSGSYLNTESMNPAFNSRFGAKAERKLSEIELYDFEWALQRTIKVPYYVHKPFALKTAESILQITNVSYSD